MPRSVLVDDVGVAVRLVDCLACTGTAHARFLCVYMRVFAYACAFGRVCVRMLVPVLVLVLVPAHVLLRVLVFFFCVCTFTFVCVY